MNKKTYLTWLKVLFSLLNKIRKEGLMSIECDVEYPEESSILKCFDLNYEANKPTITFMNDILRLMIGGNLSAEEMKEHIEVYMKNICNASPVDNSIYKEGLDTLLQIIWSALKSSMQGYAPQVSIELARFHIPLKYQPTFLELEEKLKEARKELSNFNKQEQGH